MTLGDALSELESHGTEQNRKVYRRHGVGGPQFGVSWKHLRAMAKRIGTDHALAQGLWASGNYDARILATMVADPDAVKSGELDAWAKSVAEYPLADALASFASKTELAQKKLEKWRTAKQELVAEAGWQILSHLAVDGAPTTAQLAPYLQEIEERIDGAPNRAKHAMNNALIAIGGVNDTLAKKAKATAKRIGPVEVDHGETSCKTPDAVAYIDKVRARAKAKAQKATARKAKARAKAKARVE